MKEEEFGKVRILIADDSEINRAILRYMLEEQYEIIEASDGDQVIEILDEKLDSMGLLLLDLNMPGKNGYQVLEEMNKRNWIQRLPVIVISSEDNTQLIEKAYHLGAQEYFTHPFDGVTILRRVNNIVSLYRKYEDLLNVSGQILYVCDKNTFQMLYANDEFCKKYNVSKEMIYGKHCNEFVCKKTAPDKNTCPAFCAAENNGRFEYYDSEEDRYYYANARNIAWGKKPACAVALTDITSFYKINKEQKNSFTKHMNTFMNMNAAAVTCINLNITKNQCTFVLSAYMEKSIMNSHHSVDEIIHIFAEGILEKEKKERFIRYFSRDNLLLEYEKGNMEVSHTCMYEVEKGVECLLQIKGEFRHNSITEEIELTLFCTDITDEYLNKRFSKIIHQREYRDVAILDGKKGTMSWLKYDSVGTSQIPSERYKSYEQVYKQLAEKSDNEKIKQEFFSKVNLSVVNRELKENEYYRFTIEYEENGYQKIASYKYYYFDKEKDIIFLTIEDITKVIQSDVLTGGLNRRGFIEKAEMILNQAENCNEYSILYLNIKNFKLVNRLFGMEEGDQQLKHAEYALKNAYFKPEIVGRLEGDHFACLYKKEHMDVSRLVDFCERVIIKNGKRLRLFACCGIYNISEARLDVETMCDLAKIAKDSIEDDYKKAYAIYDKSMQERYMDKAEIISGLDKAIENHEFQVYYQPVVEVSTGEIISAEALVRWQHPLKGFISPGLFIPTLEANGKISEMDLYVLHEVEKMQRLRKEMGKKRIPISVNLSWIDFRDSSMIETIIQEVKEKSIEKEMISFELTETACVTASEIEKEYLSELRNYNTKILIDDFGSGYSSFSILETYDFDILKLDMGLVHKIGKSRKAEYIIKAVIEMAHEMKIKVVAEGAETEEQVMFLKEQSCDYIQGYFFYKPMPYSEFAQLLK